jgi:hypothetical protein
MKLLHKVTVSANHHELDEEFVGYFHSVPTAAELSDAIQSTVVREREQASKCSSPMASEHFSRASRLNDLAQLALLSEPSEQERKTVYAAKVLPVGYVTVVECDLFELQGT